MRHLLKFLAVLTYDWFACRGERAANSERPTVFDAHSLDAERMAELAVDDVVFQQMCFERWEAEL